MTTKKELHDEISRLEEDVYLLTIAIDSALISLKGAPHSVLNELKNIQSTKTSGYPDKRIGSAIKGLRAVIRTLEKTP